jgi:two-component system response regulator AtoC
VAKCNSGLVKSRAFRYKSACKCKPAVGRCTGTLTDRTWDLLADNRFNMAQQTGRILVIDDDEQTCGLLEDLLRDEGYEVTAAANLAAVRELFTKRMQPDVVLLDWQLPDGDGLAFLPEIKRHWPETQVIMLTGFATFDVAVEAVKLGAFHFQSKPFHAESLTLLIRRACEHKQLNDRTTALQRALSRLRGECPPVFTSRAMTDILRLVERIAGSDAPVLITGESGTGKEVIADLIHALSPRATGPFVKVNCAALPRELIESELFGVVKGAYTGAHADRDGLFHEARGGTILLDEISEMPLDTQAKLLRVLQERSFRPVGGKTSLTADCRVLAATNRKIEEAIQEGKLREDVYYRISAVTLHLPPLRERREDILPLANAFLRRFAAQSGRNITGFSEAAARVLHDYDWPGNVRQLENEVQRAVLMCESGSIQLNDLSIAASVGEAGADSAGPLSLLENVERDAIRQALIRARGNKTVAAAELGVTRQTLYNKIRRYRLEV